MPKSFNTTGPQQPGMHYSLPRLARLDLQEVRSRIEAQKGFLPHALRQKGEYLDKAGRDDGHLILSDRRPERDWGEKLCRRVEQEAKGRTILVCGA